MGQLGYQTQYTDPTTGDVMMQARWYSPGSATFRSRDTFAGNLNTPVSLNRYTYAHNNPIRYADPSGLSPCFEICGGRLTNNNTRADVRSVAQLSPVRIAGYERDYFESPDGNIGYSATVLSPELKVRPAAFEQGYIEYFNLGTHVATTYPGGYTVAPKPRVVDTGIDFVDGAFDAAESSLRAFDYAVRNPIAATRAVASSMQCGAAMTSNPGGCLAFNTANGFRQGIQESYQEGGFDQAAGRGTAEVLSVLFGMRGLAGLNAASRTAATNAARQVDLYHATTVSNAQSIRTSGIDLGRSRANMDFGEGFYLTNDFAQAEAWATRIGKTGTPTEILHYQVPAAGHRLRGVTFEGPGPAWEDMVRSQRLLGGPNHGLDYVSGPMVGRLDGAWGNGPIGPWGHQLSIHTPRAVAVLNGNLQ